jgi:hypothetical protein
MSLPDAELNEIVREISIKILLLPEKQVQTFSTYQEFRSFLTGETEYWQHCGLTDLSFSFSQVLSSLQSEVQNNDRARVSAGIRQVVQRLVNNQDQLIYSSTALARFYSRLATEDQGAAKAAFALSRHQLRSDQITDKRQLHGAVALILYEHPDLACSAAAAEVAAFIKERTAVGRYREALGTDFEAFRSTTHEWATGAKAEFKQFIDDVRQTFEQSNRAGVNALQTSHAQWDAKMTELHRLYSEKLRLESPAQYWKELEMAYTRRGHSWIAAAISGVIALAWFATSLVYKPPDILNSKDFTLGGFKGAVIITLALSMAVYLINFLVKMATSSFHLASDARERRQLTHIYLALIKEQAMEEKDRSIILTALFSRSDTGLLKHDASPAMPTALGSLIEHLKGK